jgi:hypothetical protein
MTFQPLGTIAIVTDRRANSVAFGKGMTQYAWKRTRWNSKPPAIRGGETVLQVLLRCERYAEARKVLQEAAGDRWKDASYLLGGWSGRKNARVGKYVDGPTRELEAEFAGCQSFDSFPSPDWHASPFFGYRLRCWLFLES